MGCINFTERTDSDSIEILTESADARTDHVHRGFFPSFFFLRVNISVRRFTAPFRKQVKGPRLCEVDCPQPDLGRVIVICRHAQWPAYCGKIIFEMPAGFFKPDPRDFRVVSIAVHLKEQDQQVHGPVVGAYGRLAVFIICVQAIWYLFVFIQLPCCYCRRRSHGRCYLIMCFQRNSIPVTSLSVWKIVEKDWKTIWHIVMFEKEHQHRWYVWIHLGFSPSALMDIRLIESTEKIECNVTNPADSRLLHKCQEPCTGLFVIDHGIWWQIFPKIQKKCVQTVFQPILQNGIWHEMPCVMLGPDFTAFINIPESKKRHFIMPSVRISYLVHICAEPLICLLGRIISSFLFQVCFKFFEAAFVCQYKGMAVMIIR